MQHSDISKRGEMIVQDDSHSNSSEFRKKFNEFDLIHNRKLRSPILGHYYQLLDLPTSCIPSTILDTSLLYIPVYSHLKIYDIEPVQLPEAPSILSALRLQFSEDSKSSKEMSSTGWLSEEGRISTSYSVTNSIKIKNKKLRRI